MLMGRARKLMVLAAVANEKRGVSLA